MIAYVFILVIVFLFQSIQANSIRGKSNNVARQLTDECVATWIVSTSTSANFSITCSQNTIAKVAYRKSTTSNAAYTKSSGKDVSSGTPSVFQVVALAPSTLYDYKAYWSGGTYGTSQTFTTLATSTQKPTSQATVGVRATLKPSFTTHGNTQKPTTKGTTGAYVGCEATLDAVTSTTVNLLLTCSINTKVNVGYCISNTKQCAATEKYQSAISVPFTIQITSLIPSTVYTYQAAWSGGNAGTLRTFTTLAAPTLYSTAQPTTPATVEFPGTVILGRPTNVSVTCSLLPNSEITKLTISVFEASSGILSTYKPIYSLQRNKTLEVDIDGLTPNTAYTYTISFTQGSKNRTCPSHRFQTQRNKGSSFLFSILADTHLGTAKHCDPLKYDNTLRNINTANPDFVIFLGDDFRADNVQGTPLDLMTNNTIAQLYLNQRPFMSIVGQDAPIYNTNGNHECQEGWLLTPSCDNVPTWAITNRVEFFPNPRPNNFYQGDSILNDCVYGGLQENYYSWSWGDALFVVLDDYLYSQGTGQGWDFSLGISQHLWLSSVLRSNSNFKFVFTHHVNGFNRGGIELVPFFEWGGYSPTTTTTQPYDWAKERPASEGWTVPIQQMLEQNNVTIVFQGHDHLFVKQGWPSEANPSMLYITLPFPAFPDPDNFFGSIYDNSPGFLSGAVRAPAGHLNVEVTSTTITVNYILSSISPDKNWTATNNRTAFQINIIKSSPYGQIVVTSA